MVTNPQSDTTVSRVPELPEESTEFCQVIHFTDSYSGGKVRYRRQALGHHPLRHVQKFGLSGRGSSDLCSFQSWRTAYVEERGTSWRGALRMHPAFRQDDTFEIVRGHSHLSRYGKIECHAKVVENCSRLTVIADQIDRTYPSKRSRLPSLSEDTIRSSALNATGHHKMAIESITIFISLVGKLINNLNN